MNIYLITFILITLVASISASPWECGYTFVACPCGRDLKQEIEVPIRLCRELSYDHFPPRYKCTPCIEIEPQICKFESCTDCTSNGKSRCLREDVDPSKIVRRHCPRPLVLQDGEIEVMGETIPGGKMHYKCKPNYRLEGNATRTCRSDFHWCGKPSRCVKKVLCDTPKMPDNGNIGEDGNRYSFEYGEKITYQCSKGYVLIGSANQTCRGDGSWSGYKPICVPVISCKDPGIPKDATRVEKRPDKSAAGTPFPVGSTLTYTCADGFKLYGSTVQECGASTEWKGRQPSCVVECGKIHHSDTQNIIGGGVLPREFLPWMAAISTSHYPGDTDIDCGGSLVNERWVVTAAHCVTIGKTLDTYALDRITVYLGKVRRNDRRDDKLVQKLEVEDVYVHKDYDPLKILNDIALIYLAKDAVINKFVRPICLPTSANSLKQQFDAGVKGRVSGWGRTGVHETKSQTLRTAKVELFNDIDCLNKVLKTKGYDNNDSNAAFCAGTKSVLYGKDPKDISDASLFDSGGGLVFESCGTYDPTWYLEGVVSWGIKDGVGVYVRVSYFTDWIKSLI